MTEKYFRGEREKIDDPMMEIINALNKLNKSIEKSNTTNESISKVIEQTTREKLSLRNDKEHSGVIRSSTQFGKNAPKILQNVSAGEYRVSEGELQHIRQDMDNYEHMMATVGKSLKEFVDDPMKKVISSFKDLFSTTTTLNRGLKHVYHGEDEEPVSVSDDKSFSGALRRGILDIHGEVEAKGAKEKIGRFLGNMMAHTSGMSIDQRKAYARDSFYDELELKRATSDNPDERNKMLGHELSQLNEHKRDIRAGKVNLQGVSEEKYLKKYTENMVKSHNLRVLEKRRPDFEKKNQAKMRYELGIDPTQSYFETEAVNEKEYKKTPYVKTMESRYAKKVKAREDRKAVVDELERKHQLRVLAREEKALGAKSAFLVEDESLVPDADGQVIEPAQHTIRIPTREESRANIDPATGRAPINNEEDYPEDYATPTQQRTWQPHTFRIDDGDNLSEEDEVKNTGLLKAIEQINETLKRSEYSIKNLNVAEFKIKSLTIESLVKPDSGEQSHQPQAQQSGNPLGGLAGAAVEVGSTRSMGRFGKVGGMLGKGAKMLGKMAWPVTALMAGSDAISGYGNAAENLGIEGREATFGEKMSSAVGSVASGLSMGLIDEKSAGKGIANFFWCW